MSKKKVTISVIVPVYNVKDFVGECLDSLVNQTSSDFEAIIVDDGSTDESSSICKQYCNKFKNFFYYRKENGGLSTARNYGIEEASGDYLMFLDSDDYIDRETIRKYVELINGCSIEIDIFVGNAMRDRFGEISTFRIEDKSANAVSGEEFFEEVLKCRGNFIPSWLQIIRKDFVKRNNLFYKNGIYLEDIHHTFNSYLRASKVMNSGITHYYYRYREGSIMNEDSNIKKRIHDLLTTRLSIQLQVEKRNNEGLERNLDQFWARTILNNAYDEMRYYGTDNKSEISKKLVFSLRSSGRVRMKKLLFLLNRRLFFLILNKKNLLDQKKLGG